MLAHALLSAAALAASGLDLLYGDQLSFSPSGEPTVAMGLMTGQSSVSLRADDTLRLDYWDEGVAKHTLVPRGHTVAVEVVAARGATRDFMVDVEGTRADELGLAQAAVDAWRRRGFAEATLVETGVAFGSQGKVLDNRELRVVLPADGAAAAERLAQQIRARFGVQAAVRTRLVNRPWAKLRVLVNGNTVALAESYVRATPSPQVPIEVLNVEFGKGYAWHGHEHRRYHGEIYAAVDADGDLAAVNVLGAEDVLAGVVPSEIFASAHPQALAAQAVAARNHLLSRLGRRHATEPFHLCAEQHCQVYTGISREDPRTSRAVYDTFGQALFLGARLVDSVYSSTCGGYTEDNDVVWGDAPNPALRARPDFEPGNGALAAFVAGIDAANVAQWVAQRPPTYCALASKANLDKFRWRKRFLAAEADALVRRAHPALGPLRDIVVTRRGHGGRVERLRLVGERTSVEVLHELPIRRLFGNLSSGTFTLTVAREPSGALKSLVFEGGGWGHGVGMCQMGAIGRAEAGHDFEAILSHYYGGAELRWVYRAPLTETGSLGYAASQ